jgi:hypothetical protein
LLEITKTFKSSEPLTPYQDLSRNIREQERMYVCQRQHLAEGAFLLACGMLGLIFLIVFHKQIYSFLSSIWDYFCELPILRSRKSRFSYDKAGQHITLYSPCWQTLSPGTGQDDHLIDITRLQPLISAEDELLTTSPVI